MKHFKKLLATTSMAAALLFGMNLALSEPSEAIITEFSDGSVLIEIYAYSDGSLLI